MQSKTKELKMKGIFDKRLDDVIYTVFDFETTGLSYDNGDKIVELAFVKYSFKDGIIDEFSSLVNPEISIPYSASEIHGIYDVDVVNAPTFKAFKDKILSFINGTILVGHNVYFDLRFLNGEMSEFNIEINVPYICTMGFPGFIGGKTRQKLENICNDKGISLINTHSALDDTKATVELLNEHIKDAHSNNLFTFSDLKSKKKSYKFISSWINDLSVLDDVEYDVKEINSVKKENRQNLNRNIEQRLDEELRALSVSNRSESDIYDEPFSDTEKYESLSENKEGCYIATAVYGSYEAPEVLILRKFRDSTLKAYMGGRLFISTYYLISPSIAKMLNGKTWINSTIRKILDHFIKMIG